jgi:hypothetical protein
MIHSALTVIQQVETIFEGILVFRLIENLSGRAERDDVMVNKGTVDLISRLVGSAPYSIRSGTMTDCKRLRHYWIDWTLEETPGGVITTGPDGAKASVSLTCAVPLRGRLFDDNSQRLAGGSEAFATFVRPLKRSKAPDRPSYG